jgi:hypothetical protein
MVAHSDAETSGGTPQQYCHGKSLPRKEKQSRDGAGMERSHKKSRNPNDALGKRFVAFEDACHFHNPSYQDGWVGTSTIVGICEI